MISSKDKGRMVKLLPIAKLYGNASTCLVNLQVPNRMIKLQMTIFFTELYAPKDDPAVEDFVIEHVHSNN